MKKYSNDSKTVNLVVYDKIAILDFNEWVVSGHIAFDRYLLDKYAENYLAENFELTENDGWVRILKGGNQDESKI